MKPNFKTSKKEKTFNFYFFTTEQYDNGLDYSIENEVLLFQDECIEMNGQTSGITKNDENSLFYTMNCSSETIDLIKSYDYVVITSYYN